MTAILESRYHDYRPSRPTIIYGLEAPPPPLGYPMVHPLVLDLVNIMHNIGL